MAINLQQAAIFIDVENVQAWIREGGLNGLLAQLVREFGASAVYRRAYAAWSAHQFGECLRPLNQLGFEMINVYHPVKGKNSADIQIVVDAMELLDTRPDFSAFVLITGDSDFSPLFRRLRERGKVVVGVGPESTLSETVKSSCDRFIYIKRRDAPAMIPVQAAGAVARAVVPGARTILAEREAEEIRVRAEAARLVRSLLPQDGTPVLLAELKTHVLKLDSAFDEKIPGTFLKFLRSVPEQWRLEQPSEGNWTIALTEPESDRELVPTQQSSNNEPPVTPLQRYESFLRQKSWRFTTRTGLTLAYRILSDSPDWTRVEAVERVLDNTDGAMLSSEAAADAVRALFLIQLCERTDSEVAKYRTVRNLSNEELLRRHDLALLSRLDNRCYEKNMDWTLELARPLLLGSWDQAALELLADEAKRKAEAHRTALKSKDVSSNG